MKKILLTCLLATALLACDKKAENVTKLSTVACQDIKDEIEAYAGLIGRVALNLLVKDEFKNGAMCDCIVPVVKKELQEKTAEELDKMLIDKPMRGKVIKAGISNNMKEIFACYEAKGLKGISGIKKLFEKIIK